jgi:hypothetical protein
MRWAGSVAGMVGMKINTEYWSGSLKERDYSQDLIEDGKINDSAYHQLLCWFLTWLILRP